MRRFISKYKYIAIGAIIVVLAFSFWEVVDFAQRSGISIYNTWFNSIFLAFAFSFFFFGKNNDAEKPTKWIIALWCVCGLATIVSMVTVFVDIGFINSYARASTGWTILVALALIVLHCKKLVKKPREELAEFDEPPAEENEP